MEALKAFILRIFTDLGLFFAGYAKKEYDIVKKENELEKKRDKIDADPTVKPDDIIKRMRDNGL